MRLDSAHDLGLNALRLAADRSECECEFIGMDTSPMPFFFFVPFHTNGTQIGNGLHMNTAESEAGFLERYQVVSIYFFFLRRRK